MANQIGRCLEYLILITAILQQANSSKANYKGCKVYQIDAKRPSDIVKLKQFLKSLPNEIDVWSESHLHCQFMVNKDQSVQLEEYLTRENIKGRIVIPNVQKAIDNERAANNQLSTFHNAANITKKWPRRKFDYTKFNRFRSIIRELKRLQCRYRKKMEVIEIGRSYEERPLVVVKITSNVINECSSDKKIVWIDGGTHSREWITVAGAMWMINQLVTKENPTIKSLLETHAFYIAPVFNPDGYEYTFTDERLWRKTRQPTKEKGCIGTDPNRNWNFHWGESEDNKNPCSIVYQGDKPESESCVGAFAKLFRHLQPKLQSYWTLHSYGQRVFVPFSYTSEFTERVLELSKALTVFRQKSRTVNGVNYGVGTTYILLDNKLVFGTSMDYMHGPLNITYSFNVEMRPGNEDLELGQQADELFLISPSSIVPASKEIFEGILGVVEHIYGVQTNSV